MGSFRFLVPFSLIALGAASESYFPLEPALSYLPSFSWLNVPSLQNPLSAANNLDYTELSAFPANISAGASSSQWTYPPRCLTSKDIAEPMCVFALHSFANGRGISLVTTPSHASEFIKTPAFGTGRVPSAANIAKSGIMEERAIPGAGRGMIATAALNQGDNLYSYTPILLLHPDVDSLNKSGAQALYKLAVRWLPQETQLRFWDLGTHQDDVDPIQDRVDTNSFGFDLLGADYYVVNPEIARLNHNCRPNAVYFFDNVTLTQYVNVVRTVAPGEQLSISYIDASMSRTERQRKLYRNWGFRCSCSTCTQHPQLTRESDARLAEIDELTNMLEHDNDLAVPDLTAEEGIHAAEGLVSLYEQERYSSAMADPLMHAAMAHAAAKNYDAAKRYGRRALMATMVEEGFFHGDVRNARQLAEEPITHWSWGRRMQKGQAKSCGCRH